MRARGPDGRPRHSRWVEKQWVVREDRRDTEKQEGHRHHTTHSLNTEAVSEVRGRELLQMQLSRAPHHESADVDRVRTFMCLGCDDEGRRGTVGAACSMAGPQCHTEGETPHTVIRHFSVKAVH